MELNEVLDSIQETYLHIDRELIELTLASALSGRIKKIAPIWLLAVNVPSSGKTTITNWINKLISPDGKKLTYRLDDFTPASVQDWVKKASGKCVIVSDMVKLLEADPETFATFRLLYEQILTRRTGRGDRDVSDLEFGFSMVANSTHFIDGFFEVEAKLGGIFLKYRPHKLTLEQQMEFKSPTIKDNEHIVGMLQEFVSGLKYKDLDKVTNPLMNDLKLIAYAVEQMRSVLWKEDEILMVVPESSYMYRLAMQANFLAKSLAWMRGKKEVGSEEIETTGKAMIGTIPNVRYSIINSIDKNKGIWLIIENDREHDLGAHGLRVGMTGRDLSYRLGELEQLRILTKSEVSKTTVGYQLAPEITKALELFGRVVPVSEPESEYVSPYDEELYEHMIDKWRDMAPPDASDDELDDDQKEAIGDDT